MKFKSKLLTYCYVKRAVIATSNEFVYIYK